MIGIVGALLMLITLLYVDLVDWIRVVSAVIVLILLSVHQEYYLYIIFECRPRFYLSMN